MKISRYMVCINLKKKYVSLTATQPGNGLK